MAKVFRMVPVGLNLLDAILPVDEIEIESLLFLVPTTEEARVLGLLIRRQDPKNLMVAGIADLFLIERREFVAGSQEIAWLYCDPIRSKSPVLLRDDLPICHYRVLR